MVRHEDIRIFGCSKDLKLKVLLKKAVQYFMRQLLPNVKTITVYVKLRKDLLKNHNMHGEAWYDEDEKKSYINLNYADNVHDLISTLAHECKHIQQFRQGRLRCRNKYNLWESIKVYDDTLPYSELPWEIEAHASENKMSIDFYKTYMSEVVNLNNEMKSLENKNMYAKDWIPEIVVKKLKAGRPFTLMNGKKVHLVPDEEVIKTLSSKKPIGRLKLLSSDGKAYRFSDLAKTEEFDTEGIAITTTAKEDEALLMLIKDIDSAKADEASKTIPIKINGKIYNVYTAVSTPGTPKSDFHLVDGDGKSVVWISHKDGSKASDFRQWGGISASREPTISNHVEVRKFVADLKKKYPDGVPFGMTAGRQIKDKRLKMLSMYGNQFGGLPGTQNVNLLIQGNVGLIKRGNHYEIIASHMKSNGEGADGTPYEAHLSAVKKPDRHDGGVPYTRITINPIGSMRRVVPI